MLVMVPGYSVAEPPDGRSSDPCERLRSFSERAGQTRWRVGVVAPDVVVRYRFWDRTGLGLELDVDPLARRLTAGLHRGGPRIVLFRETAGFGVSGGMIGVGWSFAERVEEANNASVAVARGSGPGISIGWHWAIQPWADVEFPGAFRLTGWLLEKAALDVSFVLQLSYVPMKYEIDRDHDNDGAVDRRKGDSYEPDSGGLGQFFLDGGLQVGLLWFF